jgi:hypothetical protein
VLRRQAVSDGSPGQEVARILADLLDEHEFGNEVSTNSMSGKSAVKPAALATPEDETFEQMLAMLHASERAEDNLMQGAWKFEDAEKAYRRGTEDEDYSIEAGSVSSVAFESPRLTGFFIPPSRITNKTKILFVLGMPNETQMQSIRSFLKSGVANSSKVELDHRSPSNLISPKAVLSAGDLVNLREQLLEWGVFDHLRMDPAQADAAFEDGTIAIGFAIPFVLRNRSGVTTRVSMQLAERLIIDDPQLRNACLKQLHWLVTSAREALVLPVGPTAARMISNFQGHITLDSEKLFYGMSIRRSRTAIRNSGESMSDAELSPAEPLGFSRPLDRSSIDFQELYSAERARFALTFEVKQPNSRPS